MTQPITFNSKPEAQAVSEIVQALTKPVLVDIGTVDGHPVQVLVDARGTVTNIKSHLDPYRDRPERRTGTARMLDLASFIAHTKRFADGDSALFAAIDPSAPKLTAVLDYHRQTAAGETRFGKHRTEYAFPLSVEWEAWLAKNDEKMTQANFAAFIEDRVLDLLDAGDAGETAKAVAAKLGCDLAGPSRMLELSRGLTVREGSTVRGAVNLTSGEGQIQYTTEHQDEKGQPLRVPGAFLVGVAVFANGALYQVFARLRYRVSNGAVSWWYELYQTERVFEHAVREACDRAAVETTLPLFYGSPEA